jgi:hypothetical protein
MAIALHVQKKLLGSRPMISVEDAVKSAISYVNRFPNLLPTGNVRLEEFEHDDQNMVWEITLSFIDNVITGTRSYKTIIVNDNGEVISMKIRNPFKP